MRYRYPNQPAAPAPSHPKREFQRTIENEPAHQDEAVPLKKAKRFRSAFTTEQIKYLDSEFRKYPYIGSARRKEVSNALNIPERAVKIWFQNRRMKEKKDVPIEPDSEEHKNSRKPDCGNDQLSNECIVTSTNNQNYVPLPLISPKITVSIPIKKDNEIDLMNKRPTPRDNTVAQYKSSAEFSIELYKQYNKYIGKEEASHVRGLVGNETASQPTPSQPTPSQPTPSQPTQSQPTPSQIELYQPTPSQPTPSQPTQSQPTPSQIAPSQPTPSQPTPPQPTPFPKHEVSTTSPYFKLPQDLSNKGKQIKPVNECPTGYFPLNLKKYCAQAPLPVSSMVWKPVQVVPLVPGASVMKEAVGCRCDCRCGFHSAPAPALIHGASTVPQYVLTALPLHNSCYKC